MTNNIEIKAVRKGSTGIEIEFPDNKKLFLAITEIKSLNIFAEAKVFNRYMLNSDFYSLMMKYKKGNVIIKKED
jgi:hypothetical protein